MSWYNAPKDETTFKRSVFATSVDGKTWSDPAVLFTNYTHDGQENGPWTTLNGHLYTQCGTMDAGLHIETIVSVMRRVYVNTGEPAPSIRLGEIFWLNETVPKDFEGLGFKTYIQMDDETRSDAEQYLQSAVRTLTEYPDMVDETPTLSTSSRRRKSTATMKYNERSVYMIPGTRTLVNLIRGGGPKVMYVSTCDLPEVPVLPAKEAYEETLFSCRSGVGDRFLNLVEITTRFDGESRPRTCMWTDPTPSTIPDTHSRTCASNLPDGGGIYVVGGQNPTGPGRDPLTLMVAKDGINFDRHWAVRYGAPHVRYPGKAKGPGFQYPGAMVHNGVLYTCYSVGKEDIEVSSFPLESLS